jgi:hypothetical protein
MSQKTVEAVSGSNAMPLRRYFQEGLGRPLLVAIIFIAVCVLARPWRHSPDLAHFAFTLAWQCALLAVLAVTIGLRRAERTRLYEAARRLRFSASSRRRGCA